jgi:hypothetical protein
VEILPFGLILLRNGMPHQKANKDEIKLIPIQPSNAALMIKSIFRLSLRMVTGFVQSLIKLCGLD